MARPPLKKGMKKTKTTCSACGQPEELRASGSQTGQNQGNDETMKARIWLALEATGQKQPRETAKRLREKCRAYPGKHGMEPAQSARPTRLDKAAHGRW
jgi:hypothetical protein